MAGKYSSQTVRLVAHMDGAVDEEMLKKAVDATRQRFPYLCVRLCIVLDAQGAERYAYEDNPLPWVLTRGQQQRALLGEASNNHLIAFAWWDDCIALDFFYSLTDGTGAYRVLRTLLYEYCRRHYDRSLSPEGIMVAGDVIDEAEYTDPATLPRPEKLFQQPATEKPQTLNLYADALSPLRQDKKEAVHIVVAEEQLMKQVHGCGASPASWFAIVLARVVSSLHPDGGTPTVSLAVNLRKGTGTPQAHHPMVGAIYLPLRKDMLDWTLSEQVSEFRRMIAQQTSSDNLQAYYWSLQDQMNQLEQVPSSATRHELLTQAHAMMRQAASFTVSYVGKAAMGAAERYIREIRTEGNSPLALLVEVSAAGGTFCISFIQQFATDVYLDAFLNELGRMGLNYEIVARHPLSTAPIEDFRKNSEVKKTNTSKEVD